MEAFAERVAQPLLLQAPLQAVLLDLFGQLQTQNTTIHGLQLSLGTLDAREREGREAAQQAAAETGAAIQRLQSQLAAERLATEQGRCEAEARLLRLETRLHGASNLAGRQAALDDMASMLGIHVPQVALPAPTEAPAASGGTADSLATTAAASAPAMALTTSDSNSAADGMGAAVGGTAELQALAGMPVPAAEAEAASSAALMTSAEAECSKTLLPGAPGHQTVAPGSSEVAAHTDADRSVSAASAHAPASGASSRAASPLGASSSGGSQQEGSVMTAAAQAGRQAGMPVVSRVSSGRASGAASPAAGETWQAAQRGDSSSRGQGDVSAVPTASLEGEMRTSTAGWPGHSEAQVPEHSLPAAHSAADGGANAPAAPAQRVGLPSPAALCAAVQAGKAKAAAAGASAQPAAAAQRGTTAPVPAPSLPVQQGPPAVTPEESDPATPRIAGSGNLLQPGGAVDVQADGSDAAAVRPKSGARFRLTEVVDMLRKRPSLQQTGLLWKLQASLEESLEEQERLKGDLMAVQELLASVQSTSGDGLERCNHRIDGVQALVVAQGDIPAEAESSSSDGASTARTASTARSLTPRVSVGEFKALEERVGALGNTVRSGAEQLSALDAKLVAQVAGMGAQVASTAERVQRLESLREVEAAAVKLARASSTGSREDTLGALQGHLLAQQQKLAAQMEALAGGIKQGLAGQVHDAVTGAVVEVGRGLERRLADRLATKQDLQTLSLKVGSKVSREEVERMLRQHRPAPAAAEPGSGPAVGMRFKCISCDSDMQPFVFAAPLGSLPPYGGTAADLRYSQVPAASAPRNPAQHWTAAVGGSPNAAPAAGLETSRLSSNSSSTAAVGAVLPGAQVQMPVAQQGQTPLSTRPSTAASRLGAPVSWMHRMRRDTGGASVDGAGSRRESTVQEHRRESVQEQLLQHQPSLTAVGLGRPQTAMPQGGGGTPRPAAPQQQESMSGELYDVVREEPQVAGGTSSNVSAAEELEQSTRSVRASLAGGASGKGQVLPALQGSSSRIKAIRPSSSQPALLSAASADAEAQRVSSSGSVKRRSTGMSGSNPL